MHSQSEPVFTIETSTVQYAVTLVTKMFTQRDQKPSYGTVV